MLFSRLGDVFTVSEYKWVANDDKGNTDTDNKVSKSRRDSVLE
jgi:hypothetical protein